METVFLRGLAFSLWLRHVLDREPSSLPQLIDCSQKAASPLQSLIQSFIYSDNKHMWGRGGPPVGHTPCQVARYKSPRSMEATF